MRCHVCNVAVGDGQRFCHECGESLTGVTDATQPLAAIETADEQPAEEPTAELLAEPTIATAGEPADLPAPTPATTETTLPVTDDPAPTATMAMAAAPAAAAESTSMLPATEPIGVGGDTAIGSTAPTDQLPAAPHVDDAGVYAEPVEPFRLRPGFVIAILTMIATLMASIADVTDIRTNRVVDGIDNELRTLSDIGSNLPVAGFIGAAAMLVGALLQCFGLRWGAGLAGGSGLALAGWAALTLGYAELPIAAAEQTTRESTSPVPFTLTVTRDLGYWLIVAIGVLGLLVCIFSLTSAGTGGRPGLNPWAAAVGAVGAVVAATGPLIPVGTADFSSNFGTDDLPTAFFAGRLAQVGLLAVAGVIGFLAVRVYGLGLVAGGMTVPTWMWITSLLEVGDRPLGIAGGNLGSTSTSPHAVTSVGVSATLVMLVIAASLAITQFRRR